MMMKNPQKNGIFSRKDLKKLSVEVNLLPSWFFQRFFAPDWPDFPFHAEGEFLTGPDRFSKQQTETL